MRTDSWWDDNAKLEQWKRDKMTKKVKIGEEIVRELKRIGDALEKLVGMLENE